MILREKEINLPRTDTSQKLINYFTNGIKAYIKEDEFPVRFVVTRTSKESYHCEIGVLQCDSDKLNSRVDSIFNFIKRPYENNNEFNVALIIPTGIGAEIGGHDGDSGPVAKLLASIADNLITHPNVVNASDINELPDNGLYVEGSIITRLMMGTIGLQKVRSNRVLVILEANENEFFTNAAINAVNAAKATYGFNCPAIVTLNPTAKLKSEYTSSGRATGTVDDFRLLTTVLDDYRGQYDAVAIASVISVPANYHWDYFALEGDMVNPWGGVEAIFTHAVSSLYNLPSAHSPMFETQEIANIDPGVVDPRMAAEAISVTFMQSILKGLIKSPKIVTDISILNNTDLLTAKNINCLVIPDGCVGLPTLAALEQGIKVISVRENKNLMKNDLTELPWQKDQLFKVDNYWEAAGVLSAIKAGIAPESVRRPIFKTNLEEKNPHLYAVNKNLLDEER